MQQFRNMAVTSRIVRDEGSARWRLRHHYKVKTTGFATAAQAGAAKAREAAEEDAIYGCISRWAAEEMAHA